MDPRGYNYQYRRPRLSNPTYKSDYLHQSVYHPGVFNKLEPNKDKVQNKNDFFNNSSFLYNNQRQQKINEQIKKIDPYIQNLRMKQASSSTPKPSRNNQSLLLNNYNLAKMNNQIPKTNEPVVSSNYAELNQRPLQYQQNLLTSKMEHFDKNIVHNNQQDISLKKRQDTLNMSNYGSRLVLSSFSPTKINQDFIYQKQQKPYDILHFNPRPINHTHRIYPKYTLQHKLIESGLYPVYSYNPQN